MRKDTKARDFDKDAKLAISDRDSIDGWPCCVFCGAPAPTQTAWSNAHYISRAQGGKLRHAVANRNPFGGFKGRVQRHHNVFPVF